MFKNIEYICKYCGKVFKSNKACSTRTPLFCSKTCYSKSLKINKICIVCGKIIDSKNHGVVNRKYCSVECSGAARKGVKLNDEWKEALSKGRKKSNKCKGQNLYNWKGGKETESARYKIHNKKRFHLLRCGGPLPLKYLELLREIQGNKCFYCEEPLSKGRSTHIEHLTPVSRGGTNDWQNLVVSCQRCNSQKKNKTLIEFSFEKLSPQWLDKLTIMQVEAYKKCLA